MMLLHEKCYGIAAVSRSTLTGLSPLPAAMPPTLTRSFLCLDTKERTKGKISARGGCASGAKAEEKMARNFFAKLKRIKYASFSAGTGDQYSFSTLRSELFSTPFFLRPL